MKSLIPALFLFVALYSFANAEDSQRAKDVAEYNLGKNAAEHDLENGIIKYEIVGEPLTTDAQLKKIAKEHYNIDVILHGCVVGPRELYDKGYLETVQAFLVKKYGKDPIVQIDEQLQEKKNTEQGAAGNP
jgi:hypothetical protein